MVAPLAGAWIEIPRKFLEQRRLIRSLPSRERGLKFAKLLRCILIGGSLPSRERGLKLCALKVMTDDVDVAPLAGAWIEILRSPSPALRVLPSLPSRERGLKSKYSRCHKLVRTVAPFRGTKVEIRHTVAQYQIRSLLS